MAKHHEEKHHVGKKHHKGGKHSLKLVGSKVMEHKKEHKREGKK